MRNYITTASPLALMVCAKATEEGTGSAPEEPKVPTPNEPTSEAPVEPKAETPEEPTNAAPEQPEDDPWAGFEVSTEVIGREQEGKYGWDKFPAPRALKDAEGNLTGEFQYASKRIPLDGVKVDTVRGSMTKYQTTIVTKHGKDARPEFRTSVVKNDKDQPIALIVQRIK